jgi:hypothetical protein
MKQVRARPRLCYPNDFPENPVLIQISSMLREAVDGMVAR